MQNDTKNPIDKLAENEELLSQLYDLYSKAYPEYESFWSRLVRDEKRHASWIKNFQKKDEGFVVGDRFDNKDINDLNEHIKSRIQTAREFGTDLVTALSYAYEIENSLTELKYFEVYATDNPSLQALLTNLQVSTEKHRGAVKKALEREKRL